MAYDETVKKTVKILNHKNKKAKSILRRNKNGIPVFEKDQELFSCFAMEAAVDEDVQLNESFCVRDEISLSSAPEGASVDIGLKANTETKIDKNGIPFLDGKGALSKMFIRNDEEDENFTDMLESSLRGKSESAMLREKKDKHLPQPMPLKKRLKRYPPPQKQLDLHGFTAIRAQSYAEQYLRRMWRNGFFTVSIIVGRGIHSEAGAVLPGVVEDLLLKLKREGVVLWFEWDRKKKTTSGALMVYLKHFE